MPKEKRKKNTGNSKRHAPLGQVIAEDENRSKYATVRSRSLASKSGRNDNGEHDPLEDDQTLLDEKSSKRIFDLGREQLLEIEMEEQQNELERRNRKMKEMNARRKGGDSSDEEDDDEMEGGSIVGDLADDE